jgi:hypothetical protein
MVGISDPGDATVAAFALQKLVEWVLYSQSGAYPAIMLVWTLILLGCGAVLPRLYSLGHATSYLGKRR